jgi:hypothetical protein
MSNEKKLHPEPGLLLQYADGELGKAARKEVLAHLAECIACREWLSELDSGVVDYKQTWMPAWKATAEAPPKPWFDLRERMEKLDRPSTRVPTRRVRSGARWAAAAAAALIAIVALDRLSERSLGAAELLRDATGREATIEGPLPPIRITTRSGSIVRPALWRQPQDPFLATGAAQPLRTRFEAANYSWEDPLSARSFSEWRAKLPDAQDKVVERRGGDGIRSYEITTRTESGTLAEVSLRFRASDLHAIEGRLRFRDNEVVDITEVPGASADLRISPEPAAEAPAPKVPPPASSKPGATVVLEPVTPGEELRVWAALRQIDADLGEPIEVKRDDTANAILVTAVGLNPERRRALEEALSGLPKVHLRFRDPQPVREPARRLPDSTGSPAPTLVPQIEAQLGRDGAEEFVNRTLEASESLLLRAHALRELAEHYPPEIEAQLSAADRGLLDSLLANHYAGVDGASRRVVGQARLITPATAQAQQFAAQSWQAHAQNLVAAAQDLDQVLTKLLAGSGGTASQSALIDELDAALRRLEAEMAAAGPAFRRTR